MINKLDMLKYLFVFILLLTACAPDLSDINSIGEPLPVGIKKFNDGNVSCWIYKDKGISCAKIK